MVRAATAATELPIDDLPGPDRDFGVADAIEQVDNVRSYKQLLIAVAEEREIDSANFDAILAGRTHEQFEKDLARVRRRLAASRQLDQAREIESTTLVQRRRENKEIAEQIRQFSLSAQAEYTRLIDLQRFAVRELQSLNIRISDSKRYAREELERTAGSEWRTRIADLQNAIEQKQQEARSLSPSGAEFEKAQQVRQSIEIASAKIRTRQATIDGMAPGSPGRGKLQAELVLLQNQLGKARDAAKAFDERKAKVDAINAEIAELAAEIERLSTAHLDWRQFSV